MKTTDTRAAYWNEHYVDYWRNRVEEAALCSPSAAHPGDANTEEDWVYQKVFDADPLRSGAVLDVGCGWGRMFPLFHAQGLRTSGIDISSAMISAARKNFEQDEWINALEVGIAEQLPFEDETFDNIVCVAVFDATYQHEALSEFLRVLKVGGRLYLTGKNACYRVDDVLALDAERGARAKGHPNFFTDLEEMLKQLGNSDSVLSTYYLFERRGDFAKFKYHTDLQARFYEWLIVVEKGRESPKFTPFSSELSKTFRSLFP